MKVQILIPFFIYLFLLICLAFFTTRNAHSGMTGFFLGGKRINRFIVSISTVVSARGSWLLLGLTAQSYVEGLSAIWMVAGFVLSEFLMFMFLAPRIRMLAENKDDLNLVDLFLSRFRDNQNSLRIIASAATIFFLLCFISSQLMGGSRAFYALLGLSNANGVIITGVVILLFIFFGGFKTLSYSDLLTSLILLIVLIGMPIYIMIRKEGFSNLQAEILFAGPQFLSLQAITAGTVLGFLSIGLGSPGNIHIHGKYMAIADNRYFPLMAVVSGLTSLFLAAGAICTGVFARSLFPTVESIPGAESQNVYFGLAGELGMPFLPGLVLITIFAAVVSTAGSQILQSASTLTQTFSHFFFKKNITITQNKLLFYSRISILLITYFAILAGVLIKTDSKELMLFAWAGLGAGFGPAILLSFIWKNITGGGINAGILAGTISVIVWKSIPYLSDKYYEIFPGFLLATAAIIIGSFFDKKIRTQKFNRTAKYHDIKVSGSSD